MEKLVRDIIRYGEIKADKEFIENGDNVRIRVYKYKSKAYWLYMCNGSVVECYEI